MRSRDTGAKSRPPQMQEGKDEKNKRSLPFEPWQGQGIHFPGHRESAARELLTASASKAAVKN